jgi:hypothetical protein
VSLELVKPEDVVRPLPVSQEDRWATAKLYAQEIERFCYRELHEATDPEHVRLARGLLRQAIGVRRKLENWRYRG